MSGHVRTKSVHGGSGQCQVRTGQVRSVQVRLGQVKIMLYQVNVGTCQVMVRLG